MPDELTRLRRRNAELTAALEETARALEMQADFRASFEYAAVGQVHSHPDGRIIRANRAFAAMLGYEPEELVGRNGWEFTHPDDLGEAQVRVANLVGGAVDTYVREKRYVRRDGSVVWGRVSASILRTPETGVPLLTVAIVENIDAGHRAQAALSRAKQELEAVVAERTAALAQRDLLLREVYHRVKNNLQIVDSLIVMQTKRMADREGRAALRDLRERVYALGLVHHQLMGSTDLETFDIAPFLEELSSHLLEGAGSRGVALTVRAAPLRVGLDFATPLALLVTELVTNSIKHAFPDGCGAVEVSLEAAGAGDLVLRVADNGRGYDPAEVAGRPSLGGIIIEGLVRQLRGALTVTRDGGAISEIRLPTPGAP